MIGQCGLTCTTLSYCHRIRCIRGIVCGHYTTVRLPTAPTTFQVALAVMHPKKTGSRVALEARDPPVREVVEEVPKKILFPAFWATFQPVALLIPVTATMSPTAEVEGGGGVIRAAVSLFVFLFIFVTRG